MGENKLYCMRCFEAMEDGSNTCPHCGWHNGEQVKNALPYGTLLGEKYLVGQAVHVNGAGITYAALEAKTAQKVEVREFYPHTIAVRGETGASVLPVSGAELKFSDYLSEFERYAQKLLRVSDTKHIQRAIDTFSQNNTQYIVFSFTESVSLRQYVEEHGVLSWAQCEQFFYPVIHALGAIHAQNVEHLGLSPNTLRITKDDKMIVTGFDIQSVRRAGTDLIEDIFPGCWALEQYSKTKICDEVTDVYGLCASLLFALTGAAPMEAPKRKQDPRLMISKNILKQLPEHRLFRLLPTAYRLIPLAARQASRAFPQSLPQSRPLWKNSSKPKRCARCRAVPAARRASVACLLSCGLSRHSCLHSSSSLP